MNRLPIVLGAVGATVCIVGLGFSTAAILAGDRANTDPYGVVQDAPKDDDGITRIDMGGDFGEVAHRCLDAVGIYVTVEDAKATSAIDTLYPDPNCPED